MIKNRKANNYPPIIVIGLGFVGLSCFSGFSKLGLNVYGYDSDKQKVDDIRSLDGHWIEP